MTGLVALLFIANTINIGADLAAMGAAAELVVGTGAHVFTALFAVASLLLQMFVPYKRYASILKWLTLALLAYVALVFMVRVDWAAAVKGMVWPTIAGTAAITTVVAIFGTTISPYLFFWQSAQEVEEVDQDADKHALKEAPREAPREFRRIRLDTFAGMAVSNLVALAIMIGTAATLHAAGQTQIETAADAAKALKPVAGEFAFLLFSLGIIGTGLLAIPVLAGSAAYAICEARGWVDRPGAQAEGGVRILFGDRRGDIARHRHRLVADRSDQGLVLERGDQRRGRGADHGGDDDRRIAAIGDGAIYRVARIALLRLDGDAR